VAYVLKSKCNYKADKTGIVHEFPCVLTESGVLTSHVQYLYSKRSKSQSWIEKSIYSIRLLIKYINANTQSLSNEQKIKGVELLRSFTTALNLGTIDLQGEDPSGLYWKDRKKSDAKVILGHITQYTDFISEKGNGKLPINLFRRASFTEEKLNWCTYYHRQEGVFLNHLEDNEEIDKRMKLVRTIQSDTPDIISNEKAVRFPEEKIDQLLTYGFLKKGQKYPDYKNQLITMLMHYGGVRLSETFHIYVNDIIFDKENNEALVRIYHPSEGWSPEKKSQSRKNFLQERYGLRPRNMLSKNLRLHAGWKNPLLTNKERYFEVIFSKTSIAKKFWSLWIKYLKYQRINPPRGYLHPFAFTNSEGKPETIKNFRRMHGVAVRRIG